MGVFSVLSLLAGTASWISVSPTPLYTANAVPLPLESPDYEVVPTQNKAIEVEDLDHDSFTDEGLGGVYPSTPQPLAHATQAWAKELFAQNYGGAQVTVKFEPLLAVGDYLEVRLSASLNDDADDLSTDQHLIADVASQDVWYPQDLATDQGVALWAEYLLQSWKQGQVSLPYPVAPAQAHQLIWEGLKEARFTDEGLRIPIPGTDRSLLIYDPSSELTGEGQRVAKAALGGESFVGLPAPEPEFNSGEPIEFESGTQVDCAQAKCIALTFDDGPKPTTSQLLDILAREGVQATFFLTGEQVTNHPGLAQRIAQEGHILGNHTWSHPELPDLSKKKIRRELNKTAQLIEDISGVSPRLMRPPYGAVSNKVETQAAQLGYAIVQWDIDPQDWDTRDAATTVERTLKDAHQGGIILLHDIYQETIDAVPTIISNLKKQGYVFVTIPDLLEGNVEVGRTYRNGS